MATFEEARNCFFPWDQVLSRLISSKDLEFAEVVLRTYPVFQKSPTDLLTDIIELISADASKVEIRGKKKVVLTERIQVIDSVLRHWLKLQDDFLRHPELLTMLVNYVEDPKTAHLLSPATKDVIQNLKFSPQGPARKSRKKPPRPASALASSDPFPTESPESFTSSFPSEEVLGLDFIKVEDLSAALHVSEQRLLSSLTFSELL
ncbi:MAG: hypothetical protein Q8P67_13860, partial [archaeon]|nr:hypothetical protein [archaeon]